MFLAEMMLRDRMPSEALSSTSALFLMRPGGANDRVVQLIHNKRNKCHVVFV